MLVLVLILAVTAQSAPATTPKKTAAATQPNTAALQAEIKKLRAQLAECRGDQPPANNTARADAVASLRAVRSALSGGAILETFRKYQVESRIKIDALPETKSNEIIREISDLYADALTFSIARITGSISESALERARQNYASDEYLPKFLSNMQAGDFTTGYAHDMNQAGAEAASQVLMILAEEKFKDLK